MAGSPTPALSWDSASSLSPCPLSWLESRATAEAQAGKKGHREERQGAGQGHRGDGGCRTVCRLLGARVDHRWVERGARPKQEERAWESWSLGLASSSGLSRPPRESGMREGPPSSVGQRDLRVRGEQGRNAGLERPGHNGKGSRLQRSGTEASVGWSSEGPPDAQPNPTPGPPQGPQQTEPCYANLELQTLPLCEPGQPRQAETEYSTVVSAGAGSPRGDRGRARCVT